MPAATAAIVKPGTTIEFSDAVRAGVFHFELMQSLSVLSRDIGNLTLPLVKLTQCHSIAVERRKTPAIFKDGVSQQVRIASTGGSKRGSLRLDQFFIEGLRLEMSRYVLIHRSESKNLFGILQTSMGDIAHESQNDLEILTVDVRLILHSLTDQS
jgi:hypothetical protein